MSGPLNVKSASTTNATLVYSGPCVLRGWTLWNNAAYAVYVKFYDLAFRLPKVGTDTPAFKIGIGATGPSNISFREGIPFQNGFAYAITKLVADSDATVVVADDLNGSIDWKPKS